MNELVKKCSHTLVAADVIMQKYAICKGPLFCALQNGKISIDDFRIIQKKFYFAVAYFSRPMSMLISRMENPFERLDVLHNIVEEHGDFNPEKFHESTFKKYLLSLGVDSKEIKQEIPCPEVEAFNLALMGVCASSSISQALATIGIIEYAFAEVSATIGKAMSTLGWIPEEKIIHYSMHEKLDIEHACEFFNLVEHDIQHPKTTSDVHRGLELGAYLFSRLWRDLYVAQK